MKLIAAKKEITAAANADIAVRMDVPPGVYFVSAGMGSGSAKGKVVLE
jgi:N-acetylmuramic acid 6-phosphate (MurNAc-6-P) etherase